MSDTDPRHAETLAPPTDREAPTNPDNPPPAHRDAIAPAGGAIDPPTADSMFLEAVQKITRAARVIEEGEKESRRVESQRRSDHDAVLAAIQKADDNNQRSYEMLRGELRNLKASDVRQDARLSEGDKRFSAIEQSIAELKAELISLITKATTEAADKIEALERELAEMRTHVTARPETPATT